MFFSNHVIIFLTITLTLQGVLKFLKFWFYVARDSPPLTVLKWLCMHDIGATSYVFTPFIGWYFVEYSEASMACKINQKYYSITTIY